MDQSTAPKEQAVHGAADLRRRTLDTLHRGVPVVSSLLARIRDWSKPSHEKDHGALDTVCRRMFGDYAGAVADNADRVDLADILTGIAGCELAMSRTTRAMGWDPDPTPDEPEHAESVRLSGLLVAEISYCAAEGQAYRGVRCRELATEPVAAALRVLALSYDADPPAPSAGRALSELWHAVVGVIGGQAAECLVPLMIAHHYSPYACTCPTCTGPNGDHAAVPTSELTRREQVTRGCDQPPLLLLVGGLGTAGADGLIVGVA